MNSDTPKQFMLLDGLPMMMHTIQAFHRSTSVPQLIVVLHPGLQPEWMSLCATYRFPIPHTLAAGGTSRFESVKNGLETIRSMDPQASQSLIAVHDAVRPLISPTLIDRSFEEAMRSGTAALAVSSSNSVRLKHLDGSGNYAYPRENVYLMQTPQTFKATLLFRAYEQPEDPACTDDASVVEKTGIPITLVEGDTRNIKITFQDDLLVAERLLKRQSGGASDDPQ